MAKWTDGAQVIAENQVDLDRLFRGTPFASGADITGTSGADVIHRDGDGHSAGFGQTDINTVTTGNDTINALEGDDYVYADLGNDEVIGGVGNDYLFGDDGNDTLEGDNGNDILVGGQGTDHMTGGAGLDTFEFSAASEISGLKEYIDGGGDVDTLDFNGAGGGPIDLSQATIVNCETINLNGNDVTMTADQLSEFTTINAGFGTERIILAAAGTVDLSNATIGLLDELRGTAGDDSFTLTGVSQGLYVHMLAGNDIVNGGEGNDTLEGDLGKDTLSGAGGNDTIFGNDGLSTSGDGADTIDGGAGNDLLVGGAAADAITGGAGNDDIAFLLVSDISGLAETIDGGADYDYLDFAKYGAAGSVDISLATIVNMEELDLSNTHITLTASQLSEFQAIAGGFGNETLTLSVAGTVSLVNASINLIDGFYGSDGDDVFDFTGANVTSTNLYVDGGKGSDNITGSGHDDTLLGGAGTDTISGGDGNDLIYGGAGADHLSGGIGYDTFRFIAGSEISGLAEKIDGGADNDTLDLASNGLNGPIDLSKATLTSLETLLVNNETVTMTAAQMGEFTTFSGGFGQEYLVLSAAGKVVTSAAFNQIDGVIGTSGKDMFDFTGGASGTAISGLGGNDTITGTDGNDTIIGGAGQDVLKGGDGVDTFLFNDVTESSKKAPDTIKDFTHGTDIINLAGIDANSEQSGNQGFAFIGSASFSHTAGELQYNPTAGTLAGDVNGDGVADFVVTLSGHPTVTASDIVL